MADQNQSPASQASVDLSNISNSLTLSGTPNVRARRELILTVAGKSLSIASPITLKGRGMGRSTSVSSMGSSGIFTLDEQLAARYLDNWPSYQSDTIKTSIMSPTSTVELAGINPAIEAYPSTDSNFANVSLLLHMDGANNSTVFTDNSSAARTVTVFGLTKISTDQSKFGGASGYFSGSGDYLRVTSSTDLTFNADFTIEVWVYPLGIGDYMIGSSAADSNTQVFRLNESGTGRLSFYLAGTQVFSPTPAGITANQWQHLAIARSGSSTRMFVNGTQVGTTNTSWNGTFRMDVIGKFFLNGSPTAGYDYNGYIDELRITKNVARYVSDFIPRPLPFPNS